MPHFVINKGQPPALEVSSWHLCPPGFGTYQSFPNVLTDRPRWKVELELEVAPIGSELTFTAPSIFPGTKMRFLLDTGATQSVIYGEQALNFHKTCEEIGRTNIEVADGFLIKNVPVCEIGIKICGSLLPIQCALMLPAQITDSELPRNSFINKFKKWISFGSCRSTPIIDPKYSSPRCLKDSGLHILGMSPILHCFLMAVTDDCVEFFRRPHRSPHDFYGKAVLERESSSLKMRAGD